MKGSSKKSRYLNKMKKVGILGANGALGSQLVRVYKECGGVEIVPIYRLRPERSGEDVEMVDVTQPHDMEKLFERHSFNEIINTVAYNDTTKADTEILPCFDLNTAAVATLSRLCNEYDTTLVHISTDYVMGDEPNAAELWEGWDENHTPSPRNIYGISKYAGEQVVRNYCNNGIVVRVSGLFGKVGSSAKGGMNFVYMILKRLRDNELPIECVNDQWILPGYTLDVARCIQKIATFAGISMPSYAEKILHVTNSGDPITWYDFARAIAGYVRSNKFVEENVIPVKTEHFYSATPRSRHTALKSRWGWVRTMRHWQTALYGFFEEIGLDESINITFEGEER